MNGISTYNSFVALCKEDDTDLPYLNNDLNHVNKHPTACKIRHKRGGKLKNSYMKNKNAKINILYQNIRGLGKKC